MIVVFVHNIHDSACRTLLEQARARFPRLEVYEFHTLKAFQWVQGAPCLWLFQDDQNPLTDEPVYRQDIEVDLDEFEQEYQNRLEQQES